MTVKELKEILKEIPDDFKINIYSSDCCTLDCDTLHETYGVNYKNKKITFNLSSNDYLFQD